MKRSTRWTTAIAAAALLAVPAAARAQAPAPATAPPQSAQRPADSNTQQPASGAEHLRQAQAALNDIPAVSLTGAAKARVAELKRHISNLEKSGGSSPSARSATQRGSTWGTDVAAIDRILTELLGAQGATGAAAPTGTSGTTGSKTGTSITLDDTARAKLQDVRTHITAFAAAMSNTPGAPGAEASAAPAAAASPNEPSASAAASSPAASAPPTPSANAQASTPAAQTPAPTSSPAQPTEPSAAAAPQSPSPSTPSASAAPGAQQVDPDIVKKYLTAARNSLSELTQLPAAAQLTGDARTQVSQLITNFNELITTNTDWKASYAKVQANLSTLIGDQRTDESPAPAAGAAGAVGTSGTVTLDPAIRSKLVDFRTHLLEFEKVASGGGGAAGGVRTPSEPAASPSASASPQSEPAPAASAAAASAPQASSTPQASAAASEQPTSSAASTASSTASGRAAGTAGAVGTSGAAAASPAPTDTPQERPNTASSRRSEGASQAEAMRHIEAIEAILNGRAATGTSGKESRATTPSTLDRAQIEQIKTHLAELRKALNQER